MQFKVIRPHIGDRSYAVGEVREADLCDVSHLVPHVLQKMDEPLQNKMEQPVANKSRAKRR